MLVRGHSKFHNGGFDILLVRLDENIDQKMCAVICVFRLHPRTGVVLLETTSKESVVQVLDELQKTWTDVPFGQHHALCSQLLTNSHTVRMALVNCPKFG